MMIVNKIDCFHNLYFNLFVLDDIYLFIADGGSIFQTLFSTSFSDVQKSHYHMDHTIYSRWRGGYNSSTFNLSYSLVAINFPVRSDLFRNQPFVLDHKLLFDAKC